MLDNDISTKLYRLIHNVDHHFINLGCMHRDSYKETAMHQKQYKILYNTTNKHLDDTGPRLLASWFDKDHHQNYHVQSDTDSDGSLGDGLYTWFASKL